MASSTETGNAGSMVKDDDPVGTSEQQEKKEGEQSQREADAEAEAPVYHDYPWNGVVATLSPLGLVASFVSCTVLMFGMFATWRVFLDEGGGAEIMWLRSMPLLLAAAPFYDYLYLVTWETGPMLMEGLQAHEVPKPPQEKPFFLMALGILVIYAAAAAPGLGVVSLAFVFHISVTPWAIFSGITAGTKQQWDEDMVAFDKCQADASLPTQIPSALCVPTLLLCDVISENFSSTVAGLVLTLFFTMIDTLTQRQMHRFYTKNDNRLFHIYAVQGGYFSIIWDCVANLEAVRGAALMITVVKSEDSEFISSLASAYVSAVMARSGWTLWISNKIMGSRATLPTITTYICNATKYSASYARVVFALAILGVRLSMGSGGAWYFNSGTASLFIMMLAELMMEDVTVGLMEMLKLSPPPPTSLEGYDEEAKSVNIAWKMENDQPTKTFTMQRNPFSLIPVLEGYSGVWCAALTSMMPAAAMLSLPCILGNSTTCSASQLTGEFYWPPG